MNNLYLVLSVAEISRMLKVAKASQRAVRNPKSSHSIVLRDIRTSAKENIPDQINSVSFMDAVAVVAEKTAVVAEKTAVTEKPNALDIVLNSK